MLRVLPRSSISNATLRSSLEGVVDGRTVDRYPAATDVVDRRPFTGCVDENSFRRSEVRSPSVQARLGVLEVRANAPPRCRRYRIARDPSERPSGRGNGATALVVNRDDREPTCSPRPFPGSHIVSSQGNETVRETGGVIDFEPRRTRIRGIGYDRMERGTTVPPEQPTNSGNIHSDLTHRLADYRIVTVGQAQSPRTVPVPVSPPRKAATDDVDDRPLRVRFRPAPVRRGPPRASG